MNSLPKTVTRQRRGCDLNPGPSAPESSTLTTRQPCHRRKLNSAVHVVTYLDGVVALCGFSTQHDAVGAVQHSIGHVGRLGARRPRLLDHALQHLGSTDHRLASTVAPSDHHLLCQEHLQTTLTPFSKLETTFNRQQQPRPKAY